MPNTNALAAHMARMATEMQLSMILKLSSHKGSLQLDYKSSSI